MVDVNISLDPTPRGLCHARVTILGTHPGEVARFNSLHTSRSEALDEALLLVKAEVQEMGA